MKLSIIPWLHLAYYCPRVLSSHLVTFVNYTNQCPGAAFTPKADTVTSPTGNI